MLTFPQDPFETVKARIVGGDERQVVGVCRGVGGVVNERGRVPTGSEGSIEVCGIGMEVIGVVVDMAPSSGKGVRYGAFGGGGVTTMVVEVLLGVGGFDVDRGAEMTIFNTDIDVQKSDMGGGSVPGEVDGILTVQLFKEISEGVRPMGPEYEYVIDKPQK